MSLINKRVEMQLYGGKKGEFIVINEDQKHLILCKPDELELAKKQKRDPHCIGFLRELLIKVLDGES